MITNIFVGGLLLFAVLAVGNFIMWRLKWRHRKKAEQQPAQ